MDTRPRSVVTVARASIFAGMLLLMACPPAQRPGTLPPLGLRAAVAIDAQHNQIVAGTFADEVQLGGTTLKSAGGSDVFVAKFNPEGKLLWPPLRFGGLGNETINGVAVSAKDGSIAFVGTFTRELTIERTSLRSSTRTDSPSGVFIAALDPDGKLKWAHEIMRISPTIPMSVAFDPENGNIAVGGTEVTSLASEQDKLPQVGMSILLTLLSPGGEPIGSPTALAASRRFTCVHSPCVAGAPLFGFCDWCVANICAKDSTCCTDSWDQIKCVNRIDRECAHQRCNCSSICTPGFPFNAYACQFVGQVCGDIPSCCETGWTRDCVIDANNSCGAGCPVP